MRIVEPHERTTLLLNKYHEPFGVCTARAAFRHLMTNRVVGIDATDSIYNWDGKTVDVDGKTQTNYICWKNGNIQVFDDQPVLRSAPNLGEIKHWYIPTVVRCNDHFGYRAKGNKDLSLRKTYEIYKKTCQYCLNVIPFSDATKDHLYPKSRGGSNYDFNIVLACKKCNNAKDSNYPYYNKDGGEVKVKKTMPSGMFLPDEKLIRSEWRKYLYIE